MCVWHVCVTCVCVACVCGMCGGGGACHGTLALHMNFVSPVNFVSCAHAWDGHCIVDTRMVCHGQEEGSKRYVVCPGQHVRSEEDNGAAVTLYDKHQAGLDNIHFVPSGTVYLTQVCVLVFVLVFVGCRCLCCCCYCCLGVCLAFEES